MASENFDATYNYTDLCQAGSQGSSTIHCTCKQDGRECLLSSKVGDLLSEVSAGVHRADRLPSNLDNACIYTHTHTHTHGDNPAMIAAGLFLLIVNGKYLSISICLSRTF